MFGVSVSIADLVVIWQISTYYFAKSRCFRGDLAE